MELPIISEGSLFAAPLIVCLSLLNVGCEKNDARNASGSYQCKIGGVQQEIHVDIPTRIYSYTVSNQDGLITHGSGKILLYPELGLISKRSIGFQDMQWLPYTYSNEHPHLVDPVKLRSLPKTRSVFFFDARKSGRLLYGAPGYVLKEAR